MTIGAVLIVKNEGVMLDRCLKSLQGFDEIVVLDTGSTDATCDIARKYTDKVYEGEYKWNDNFAEARNYALGKSTTDFVVSIDADEFLEEHGLVKIKALIEARPEMGVFDVTLTDEKSGSSHFFPRLFKRSPDTYWKGCVHNYLSKLGETKTNVTIMYGSSPAHSKDPGRAFRILTKFVSENPRCVREKFYLAREYMYQHKWEEAIKWYDAYVIVSAWPPEKAEAYYQAAVAYQQLGNYGDSRRACLNSIGINADYFFPLELMAYLSGPINKERWLEFSETAKNAEVLFTPGSREKGSGYYDSILKSDKTMDRYDEIHDRIVEKAGADKCVDAGCGDGRLLNRLPVGSYGFDFSEYGVTKAGERAFIDSVYTHEYKDGYTLVMTEVLEHVDDIKAIDRIPPGTRCILSVPSFLCTGHVRMYTKKSFMRRLGKYFKDVSFEYFYFNKKWTKDAPYTNDYIMLIEATRV